MSKGSAVLKKITTEAKRIYKRGGTWAGAIEKAGAKYREGKIGKVVRMKTKNPRRKKKAATAKRKRIVKRIHVLHKKEGKAIRALGSVSHHISHAKHLLAEQIGWAELHKFQAKTKRAKRKVGKKIADLKSRYRKLC